MAASRAGSNPCARGRRSTPSSCGSWGSKAEPLSIEALVARYGLVALALGAGFEGETSVVAGGLLAHEGLLTLPGVMAAAAGGSFVADQLFFAIGRRFRDHPRVRRIAARPAFARALDVLERYPRSFIFGFRFLYGLRTVSPIAIGTSHVPTRTFVALNAVAAIVWGVVFASLGYVFGQGVAQLFGRLRPSGPTLALLLGGVALVAAAIGALRWWHRREEG